MAGSRSKRSSGRRSEVLRRFAATRHCATYRAAAPRDVTYHNATVPISLIALRVAPRRSASRGVATCRHVTLCPSTQRNVFADFSSTAPLLFSSLSHAALPRVTCRISTRHNVISFSAAYRCAARPASRPLGAPHRPATQRNALVYSPPPRHVSTCHAAAQRRAQQRNDNLFISVARRHGAPRRFSTRRSSTYHPSLPRNIAPHVATHFFPNIPAFTISTPHHMSHHYAPHHLALLI